MGSVEGITSLGLWGGRGGDPWRFIASRGINEIVIQKGENIKSISFRDADGLRSGTFGGNNPNDIGETEKIVIKWPSEYLISIDGSYGTYAGLLVITSLSFTTNQTKYGPFGATSGNFPFSIPMESDIIVGFFGRSGNYLDAIGIYVKPGDSVENISFGQWGGPGGDQWSFKANSGINEIVVYHGDNIKSISFRDANGQQSGKYGGNNLDDPSQKEIISIDWPLEHLTSIYGSYGTYNGLVVITSLSFITNRATYGPFGKYFSGNTYFSIPMEGGVIVGFYGSADYYLDAIGIYVKSGSLEGSISLGPWGGQGGHLGSFMASCGINQITLYEADNIKSISFRDTTGLQSWKFGGKSPNDIGNKKIIDIDSPTEYLRSITGSYGTYNGLLVITSLSFITNRTTHGPFGKYSSGNTSFSIPMEGGVIVGFYGRGGNFLDAIGIYVKPEFVGRSISFEQWGGPGGDPWTFIAGRGINMIVINHGINIKSISFRDTDGNHSGTFGGMNPNDPGKRTTIEIDWPSEHLTSITGSYGNYNGLLVITSLSFSTNRTTYGRFGTTSGTNTAFSAPMKGGVIIGFHGRGGHYLDAIGISVKPVSSLGN